MGIGADDSSPRILAAGFWLRRVPNPSTGWAVDGVSFDPGDSGSSSSSTTIGVDTAVGRAIRARARWSARCWLLVSTYVFQPE